MQAKEESQIRILKAMIKEEKTEDISKICLKVQNAIKNRNNRLKLLK